MTSDEVVSCKSHYMGLAGEYTSKITGGFFDPMPTFLGDKDKADIRVGNEGIKIAADNSMTPAFEADFDERSRRCFTCRPMFVSRPSCHSSLDQEQGVLHGQLLHS